MEHVMQSGQPIVPDKKLAAVCGLFCPSCSLFIASMEDPARLRGISERFGIPPQELECHGCRSDKRGFYCRQHCKMTECAAQRGLDFCGECDEFPARGPEGLSGADASPSRAVGITAAHRRSRVRDVVPGDDRALLVPGMPHRELGLRWGMSRMWRDAWLTVRKAARRRDLAGSYQAAALGHVGLGERLRAAQLQPRPKVEQPRTDLAHVGDVDVVALTLEPLEVEIEVLALGAHRLQGTCT